MKNLSLKICFKITALFAAPTSMAEVVQQFLPNIASDLRFCPSSGFFFNCFGSRTWSSGDKYVGEWGDDEPHGQGTFTYADGPEYVGEYKNGRRHGQGTLTRADGTVKEGVFEDGKFLDDIKIAASSGSDLPLCPPSGLFDNCFGAYNFSDREKYVGE